jgi:raffinose/stachyose/melibiose transport system substrate-binding protein
MPMEVEMNVRRFSAMLVALIIVAAMGLYAAPVKLEFFSSQAIEYPWYKALIEDFNKANPSILIEPNNAPEPEKVLQTRVMSNSVPDICSLWSSSADFKQYARDDVWLDLTGQAFLKKVDESFLNSLKVNGKDYSLPYASTGVGIWYNKKIFSDNNLTPPKTYDDLISIAKKLKAKGITAFAFADKDDWTHGKLNTPLYVVTIPNFQQFFADLAAGKTSAKSNPSYRKFAMRVLELRNYCQPDTLGTDYTASVTLFASGKTAMLIEGNWVLDGALQIDPKLDIEMIPFPGDTATSYNFPITIDTSFAISSAIKNKAAALKLFDFFATMEAAQKYANLSSSPMLIKGIVCKVQQLKPVLDAYSKGKSAPWPQDLWPAQVVPENYKVVQSLVLTKDIDKFLSDTDKIFAEARQ